MPQSKSKRSRYTAPPPKKAPPSPLWYAVAITTLLGLGLIIVVTNYLGLLPGEAENRYLILGLVLISGGFHHDGLMPGMDEMDVDQVVAARRHGKDVRPHRLRAARDLVGRLALGAERDEETGDLRLGRLARHDPRHRLARLLARQAPAVYDLGDRARDHDRKFLAIAGPSGVSTLSGWNWTPSTGSSA